MLFPFHWIGHFSLRPFVMAAPLPVAVPELPGEADPFDATASAVGTCIGEWKEGGAVDSVATDDGMRRMPDPLVDLIAAYAVATPIAGCVFLDDKRCDMEVDFVDYGNHATLVAVGHDLLLTDTMRLIQIHVTLEGEFEWQHTFRVALSIGSTETETKAAYGHVSITGMASTPTGDALIAIRDKRHNNLSGAHQLHAPTHVWQVSLDPRHFEDKWTHLGRIPRSGYHSDSRSMSGTSISRSDDLAWLADGSVLVTTDDDVARHAVLRDKVAWNLDEDTAVALHDRLSIWGCFADGKYLVMAPESRIHENSGVYLFRRPTATLASGAPVLESPLTVWPMSSRGMDRRGSQSGPFYTRVFVIPWTSENVLLLVRLVVDTVAPDPDHVIDSGFYTAAGTLIPGTACVFKVAGPKEEHSRARLCCGAITASGCLVLFWMNGTTKGFLSVHRLVYPSNPPRRRAPRAS